MAPPYSSAAGGEAAPPAVAASTTKSQEGATVLSPRGVREELQLEVPETAPPAPASPARWFDSWTMGFGRSTTSKAAAATATDSSPSPTATTTPVRIEVQVCWCQPGPPGEEAAAGKCHLVVLVNGVAGYSTDWDELYAQAGCAEGLDHVWFYPSIVNGGSKTFDGIDVCGDRLVEELRHAVAVGSELTHISFVGHSMGGLISRYVIGKLYNEAEGRILGLQPAHFITLATPHLGCDGFGLTQVPLLGWAGEVPLIGDSIQKAMAAAAAPVTAVMFGRSGQQLWFQDTGGKEASGEDGVTIPKRPLIELLASDAYLAGLRAFRTRTAYANVAGDHLVGWANSSLRFTHQLPPLETFKDVVNIRTYGPGEGLAAREGEGGSDGIGSGRKDGAREEGIELKEFTPPTAAVEGGGEAQSQCIATMLMKLQNLEWRRVDVWIRDPISHFMAHNHIQVTSKWANKAGLPIVKNLLDLLASMEGRCEVGSPSSQGADSERETAAK